MSRRKKKQVETIEPLISRRMTAFMDDATLEQRRIILDQQLLGSPPVVAQRIRVELLKECQRFPEILLPNTLIL